MTRTDVALYFAYGSNMSAETMESKCPNVAVVGRARLDGHRLAFNRRSIRTRTGVVSVVADPESSVWGVLYEVGDECREKLDRKEGYPWAYDRRWIDVTLESGESRRAVTYVVAKPESEAVEPSLDYMSGIINAAVERRLPTAYVESLRAIIPTRAG